MRVAAPGGCRRAPLWCTMGVGQAGASTVVRSWRGRGRGSPDRRRRRATTAILYHSYRLRHVLREGCACGVTYVGFDRPYKNRQSDAVSKWRAGLPRNLEVWGIGNGWPRHPCSPQDSAEDLLIPQIPHKTQDL